MSAADIDQGGQLIQFGLSVRSAGALQSISFLIKPTEEMYWDEKAAKVHLIPYEVVHLYGTSPEIADDALYRWLVSHGANPKNRAKTVPVGFNITGFDLPFVKKTLPKVYSLLSRRTAELNGMLWLLNGKNGRNFEAWKQLAMDYAHNNLDDYVPHDAEWDAKRHLLCYEYLQSVILDK